uniref:DUF4781 domain-containing protein n=1 Tax=Anopheles christyi TaxID=43041 RepID=A0A182JP85_9DIPT
MSLVHIARIMHDFLHRGVERKWEDLLQFDQQEEFFTAKTKPHAVNLLAFALGKLQPDPSWTDNEIFERPELLPDRMLYKQLANIVDRMPTHEFQFIPLVILLDEKLQTSLLMRVRKTSNSAECVYLDLSNRKYDKFPQFLTSNTLPTCMIWFPIDGRLRYTQNNTSYPMLAIESRRIERRPDTWKNITAVGTVVASALTFTPFGAPVGIPLMFVSTAASSGFSISNLIDGCKHEKGKVVAGRAVALAFSLTSFASTGLTVACRVEKVRRLIPAEKLIQLERAERLLCGGLKGVATGATITAAIGSAGGWLHLSTSDRIELGAVLCFAYRQEFNWKNINQLILTLQQAGVVKFFRETCPNVSFEVLRKKLEGSSLEYYLLLVGEYLGKNVSFSVDDNFTTIKLFGYEMKFDMMFNINWEQLKMLLLFLQTSKGTINNTWRKASAPLTPDMLNDVMQLLHLVGSLKDIPCTLADYITLGQGHRFSFATLRIFISLAVKLDRLELLKQLAALSTADTERLTVLRESGGIEGGDLALFNWLGCHSPGDYCTALTALIELATYRPRKKAVPFKFENRRILISSLLGVEAKQFLEVPRDLRDILLQDERFLKLCNDAGKQLLPRANLAWIRTCSNGIDTICQLETIGLLKELFAASANPPLKLTDALNYALDIENSTVPQVYYSILAVWKQFTIVPLTKQTFRSRFQMLLEEAQTLEMVRYYTFYPEQDKKVGVMDDQTLIKKVRTMLPILESDTEGNVGTDCSIPFGTPERAACWLGFMPELRHARGRKRTYQALIALLANGTGTVLVQGEQAAQQYVKVPEKKMLMFCSGNNRVVIEVLVPQDPQNGYWRASFYLCGNTFCAAEPKA